MNSPPSTIRASLNRPGEPPVRVLVVDDDDSLRELLVKSLRREGCDVRGTATGSEAIRNSAVFLPDAVVLDMMLPDMAGVEVLRALRAGAPDLAIIFLTARDRVADRLAGLGAGADDYMTKPFSLDELLARLGAVLRRVNRVAPADSAIVVGDLMLDEDSHAVTRDGEEIRLTKTEFQVLLYFMQNPRRILSKSQILEQVWGWQYESGSNVVELYVSYLRRKIDGERPRMIHTVRGMGYVLKPPGP